VTPESAGSSLESTPEEEKTRTALIVGACSTSADVTTVAPIATAAEASIDFTTA
jgi:hypothetical protein